MRKKKPAVEAAPERVPTREGAADNYRSPFSTRYAGKEMRVLFSERARIRCWRELWLVLAEEERALGLEIPAKALLELRKHIDSIDFARAAELEKQFRHDVMAHLHTFAELHPPARPFLHLGATSCYLTDNADLVTMRAALELLRDQIVSVIERLVELAQRFRELPTLGYTHFQPAQPTTVGKRVCLWIQDLLLDLEEACRLIDWLPFRGVKGTTGTQASFLSLFDGDHRKVKQLEARVSERMGFRSSFPVTGQTYPRKLDWRVMSFLCGVAQSAAKAGNDLRLLAHEREIEEPFESSQVGSSAMAYKRNPMRAERMVSMARFLVNLAPNAADTACQQWLERTLDDSANRRLALSEGFLCADSILRIYHSIASGMIVREPMIQANLERELPFLCTEDLLLAATKAGGDRQTLHERIRVHSRAAVDRLKNGAHDNDLFQRLLSDDAFAKVRGHITKFQSGRGLVGRAPQQVSEFLQKTVAPHLRKCQKRQKSGRSAPSELEV